MQHGLRPIIRRLFLVTLLAMAATVLAVRFARTPQSASTTPGERQGVRVEDLTFAQRAFTVCEVDLTRAEMRLFWRRSDGTRYANFAALNADYPIAFATNASIFDPNFTPCGLHVAEGREYVPLNLRDAPGNFYLKPNGVFVIDEHGARVIETARYAGTTGETRLATQSGPMLVIDDVIHPRFATDSVNRRVRSGVGVRSADHVVFAISREPVTFFEFARLFQQKLHCPNALYLDGEISRFYVRGRTDPQDGDFAGILAVVRPK